jgi:competence protein ComEC
VSARFPALWVAIAFACGVLVGGEHPAVASGWRADLAAASPAAAAASASRAAGLAAAFALGAARGAVAAPRPLRDTRAFAADSLWVGRVVARRSGGFRIESARAPRHDAAGGAPRGASALRGAIDVLAPGDPPPIGAVAAVAGRLEVLDGRRNPGLPDPRLLARRDRVVARLRADAPPALLAPPGRAARAGSRLDRLRARFVAHEDALYPADVAVFMRALFLGDRSEIDPSLRADFRDTGCAHLLALSGQHVVLIALVIARALALLRVPRALHPPVGLCALGAYLALVGAPASAARAGIVLALLLCAQPLRRRSEPGNTLGAALLVLLALHPEDLWDVGLVLSFAATAGLVFLLPPLRARCGFETAGRGVSKWIVEPLLVTLAATWPLAPLEALLFGAIPIVGPATNLVLVPATGLLLTMHITVLAASAVPWALAGLPSPAVNLAAATAALTRASLAFVRVAAAHLPPPVLIEAAARPAAAALLLAPLAAAGRARGAPTFGALAAPLAALVVLAAPGPPPLRVTLLDVGQGDAILVEGPGARALVDAGPAWAHWDAGERVVAPVLRARGIRSLDALVLSHADADHCGGAAAVVSAIDVRRLLESDSGAPPRSAVHARLRSAAADRGVAHAALRAGDRLDLGRARGGAPTTARVLHPPRGPEPSPREAGGNARSVVLDVSLGDVHILLTGDLPAEQEADLRRDGRVPRGAILKVAHHGSRGSSSAPFLEALDPPCAVVSVGERNRYGHPHPAAMERLAAGGAPVLRTDRGGALKIATDGALIVVTPTLGTQPAVRLVRLPFGSTRPVGRVPRAAAASAAPVCG